MSQTYRSLKDDPVVELKERQQATVLAPVLWPTETWFDTRTAMIVVACCSWWYLFCRIEWIDVNRREVKAEKQMEDEANDACWKRPKVSKSVNDWSMIDQWLINDWSMIDQWFKTQLQLSSEKIRDDLTALPGAD